MISSPALRSFGLAALLLSLAALPTTLPGCAEDSAGIEVPVTYRAAPTPPEPLESADGAALRLTALRVAIDSLELRPCPEPVVARALWLLMPSVARAHSAASPLRIGTPVVLDGLGEDSPHPGTFRPTPGSYCGVRGMLAVPDEDALGADPATPLLAAVELSGERLSGEGALISTFSLGSSMSVSFERDFDAPLELSAAAPYAELGLVLDAVDLVAALHLPDGPLDAAGASALSQAAADALRVELVRAAP